MKEERLNLMRDEAADSLDGVLNRALQRYATAAPRLGFEARILAGIDADLRESRKAKLRWLIPALTGVGLVCVALMLVLVIQPGKKEIGVVREPAVTKNLDAPEQGTANEISSGISWGSVRPKRVAVAQEEGRKFEVEQERLIRELMANGPEAIRSLARMDREADAAEMESGEPMKIAPIKFERIEIQPIETKDNSQGTETDPSDAASE